MVENWNGIGEEDYLVKSLEEVIKEDLEGMNDSDSDFETVDGDGSDNDDGSEKASEDGKSEPASEPNPEEGALATTGGAPLTPGGDAGETTGEVVVPVPDSLDGNSDSDSSDDEPSPIEWIALLEDNGEEIALGLRVYTQTKDEPAVITGRIKSADETWEW